MRSAKRIAAFAWAAACAAAGAADSTSKALRVILPDYLRDVRTFNDPLARPVSWTRYVVNAGWGGGRGAPARKGGWIDKHFELIDYIDRSGDYVSHHWLRHRGVWHEVYGSNEYQETIHFVEKGARALFWNNGVAQDPFGERVLSPQYNTKVAWWKKRVGWDAFIVCNNAPRWSAVINYDLLTSPLFGDAMSQDNIGGPLTRIGAGSHGRYCDYCNRKFFHYLRSTGRLPEFRRRYARVRDYVRERLSGLIRSLPPYSTKGRFSAAEAERIRKLCDDPVMAEYMKFLYISHLHNFMRYYREEKLVARRAGREFDVHGNMGGGFVGGDAYQIALADFVDTIWFESAGQSTYDLFMHHWHNAWGAFRFEMGRAMTRGVKLLMCMSKFHKATPDLVAHELAEPCAGGAALFVFQDRFEKQPAIQSVMEAFLRFRHEHRALFAPHRMHRHCQTALLYSTPTMMYRNYMPAVAAPPTCALIGMARGLQDHHIPFDVVIFNHPEIHDDFADLDQLKRYRLLILPVVECLSDAQIEKIGRYLDAGGVVGVIGVAGARDENNRPRSGSVIAAWRRRGRVVDLTPTPDFIAPRGDAKRSKQATDDAARRVEAVLGSDRIIAGDLPASLWVTSWRHDCGAASFHFVNYDIDFASGAARPTAAARVRVRLPKGVRVEEAAFLAPGRPARPLAVRAEGGRASFVLPPIRVYGVVVIGPKGLDRAASDVELGDALYARARYACAGRWGAQQTEADRARNLRAHPRRYAEAARRLLEHTARAQEAAYVRRIRRMADASGATVALDFGGVKVSPPWKAVAADTSYTAARGFGWMKPDDLSHPTPEETYYAMAARYFHPAKGAIYKSARQLFWPYRAAPPPALRYSLYSGERRRFRIDLKNGLYRVRVVTQMPSWLLRNFLVSGMVAANGEVKLLDLPLFKGGYAARRFTVRVVNGRLDLSFGGATGWGVAAVVVSPADKPDADPLAEGAVREWKISPRYANSDWFPINQTFGPPEANPAAPDTSGWRTARAPRRGVGLIDLGDNTATNVGDIVYACAVIRSASPRPARLHVGASSQAVVWLNGRRIAYLPNVKGVERDEFVGPVQLKAGRNTLLIKLCRFWERRWLFYASVTPPLTPRRASR